MFPVGKSFLFGAAFAVLAWTRMPIDRSFVSRIGESLRCTAIVGALTGLAASLGIVTTEGVETAVQRAHLPAEGCNEVQGFLFGRPVGASQVPDLPFQTDRESVAATA